MPAAHRELQSPSGWVERWAAFIPAGGRVLDLACGAGRHARFLAARGLRVLAVDRDVTALSSNGPHEGIEARRADLERDPWPFAGELFDGIVVTNYLYRPLLATLVRSVADRGVLVYETFAAGNERYGRPSNPDFLLRPGELLEVVRGQLRVLAYEELLVTSPRPAMVQRICARREALAAIGA